MAAVEQSKWRLSSESHRGSCQAVLFEIRAALAVIMLYMKKEIRPPQPQCSHDLKRDVLFFVLGSLTTDEGVGAPSDFSGGKGHHEIVIAEVASHSRCAEEATTDPPAAPIKTVTQRKGFLSFLPVCSLRRHLIACQQLLKLLACDRDALSTTFDVFIFFHLFFLSFR